MEIVKWVNNQGQTIRLSRHEAIELKWLIDEAITQGEKESRFINLRIEIEEVNNNGIH